MGSPAVKTHLLEASHICLDYRIKAGQFKWDKFRALNDVSFVLEPGETLGILGRNGCGKSSLLRVLAGIVNPSSGGIRRLPGIHCSLLTIGLGFRFDLSGRDNAILSMMYQGSSKKEAIASLPEICEFAELDEFFDQKVGTYSNGMRARLGFATAMKSRVDILLIDETLSVGDERFRARAQAAMDARIHARTHTNQAVVLVSHNGVHIDKNCDRAIWLERGEVRSTGDTAVVVNDYRTFLREM